MDWLNKDTITAVASCIAAIVGLLNFLSNARNDRILVKYGSYENKYLGHTLIVQNLSPFEVHLHDVGFVTSEGKLMSLVAMKLYEHYENEAVGLDFNLDTQKLPPRSVCNAFLQDPEIVAAYAISTSQKFFRIDIDRSIGYWQRLKLRWNLYQSCL